jgi:hypothetical protein
MQQIFSTRAVPSCGSNPITSTLTFNLLLAVTDGLVTGLVPSGAYNIATQDFGDHIQFTVTPGTMQNADAGGVLAFGAMAPKCQIQLPLILRD